MYVRVGRVWKSLVTTRWKFLLSGRNEFQTWKTEKEAGILVIIRCEMGVHWESRECWERQQSFAHTPRCYVTVSVERWERTPSSVCSGRLFLEKSPICIFGPHGTGKKWPYFLPCLGATLQISVIGSYQTIYACHTLQSSALFKEQ